MRDKERQAKKTFSSYTLRLGVWVWAVIAGNKFAMAKKWKDVNENTHTHTRVRNCHRTRSSSADCTHHTSMPIERTLRLPILFCKMQNFQSPFLTRARSLARAYVSWWLSIWFANFVVMSSRNGWGSPARLCTRCCVSRLLMPFCAFAARKRKAKQRKHFFRKTNDLNLLETIAMETFFYLFFLLCMQKSNGRWKCGGNAWKAKHYDFTAETRRM